MEEVELNEVQVIANWGFKILAAVAALGIFVTLRRKPRHMLVFLLGLGNILFLSVLLGFSAYVRGFLPRFMVDRIFELPYIFFGLLIAAILMFWLPKGKRNLIWLTPSWIVVIGVILLSQLAWLPIWRYFEPGTATHATEREAASEIASNYEGGVISLMEDRPWLTYFLARDHGIPGKAIEGQMYDPFAYISGDPFANWAENREIILDWFSDRNISLLVFYSDKHNYREMVRTEPGWFQHRAIVNNGTIDVYAVRAP